jgi:hypothetical protein
MDAYGGMFEVQVLATLCCSRLCLCLSVSTGVEGCCVTRWVVSLIWAVKTSTSKFLNDICLISLTIYYKIQRNKPSYVLLNKELRPILLQV